MFRQLTWKSRARVQIAALCVFASLPLAHVTRAQTTEDPNVVAAARALAVEGVKLAQDQRCEEAIDKLERAEQLRHSAIVLEQLGECYIARGRLVEGAEAMRSVLREGLPENPSEAMKRAQTNARSMLDATKAKIAMLTITVEVVGNTPAEVAVDGQPLPAALIGAARPTDPGEHTVEATALGHLPAKRRITLAPGQVDTLALPLIVDPAGSGRTKALAIAATQPAQPVAQAAREAPAPGVATTPASPQRNLVPAYIAWGTAAAGLAVGAAFGLIALDQKSDLDQACPDQRCPPSESDNLDTAQTNGLISTIGFGVGIGAALLGGVFYLLADESPSETQPKAAGRTDTARAARSQIQLGLTGAELRVPF